MLGYYCSKNRTSILFKSRLRMVVHESNQEGNQIPLDVKYGPHIDSVVQNALEEGGLNTLYWQIINQRKSGAEVENGDAVDNGDV